MATVLAAGGVALAGVVSSSPSPSPSFNGPVYAMTQRGDTVYVGGSFTGAVVNGRTTARDRLAALDARTGQLLPWNPGADDTVRALATTGSTVYAAGDFGTVAGQKRDSLAALDAATGALGTFKHAVGGQPNALAAGNGRLYVGGRLTEIDGSARLNLAAFTVATGSLDEAWRPTTDDTVNALAVAGNRVYLGGAFHKTNNVSSSLRLTAVDAANGTLDKGFLPKPPSQVFALTAAATGVWASLGGQGGRAVSYTTDGRARWTRVFDGDAQAIAHLDGITYVGGHFDKACTTTNNGTKGTCTDGSVPRVKLAAVDADGNLTDWAPAGNGVVGVRAMLADPGTGVLSAGGDFTTIGGTNHKRYVAFGTTRDEADPEPPASPYAASYNFDSTVADGTWDDGSGKKHLLRLVTANGATVTGVAHGNGRALAFPAVCTGDACPRAALQATGADLNPGGGDFRFGAAVLAAAGQGGNIVQKGTSGTSGQYKLQVDAASGKPGCVVSGAGATTTYAAKSKLTAADGSWHSLECRRAGTTLTLLVDDTVRATATVPATLSIGTTQPLSVGARGAGTGNDQFHGTLDDVWVAVD